MEQPAYRSGQIWQGLYQQLLVDPGQFSTLPGQLRENLALHLDFNGLTPVRTIKSTDGETIKSLFKLRDGAMIEAVLMTYKERRTVCISTQVGCAVGCVFCATGQMKFTRHLTSGEIILQVLYYARMLQAYGDALTNVVIMGMGEPFYNYDATLKAVDILNDPKGFNFGARRFTISTVGIVPMIEQFAHENRQVNLAVSLHAAEDDLRSKLIPINRKYPLFQLIQACREYIGLTHRRITFEWALIDGVNDSPQDAARLAALLRGMLCHVNVIPLNPTHKYPGQPSQRERVDAFVAELGKAGIPTTVRTRRGVDIHAGCGQLATQEKSINTGSDQ
ncbi:MAG TPA: 23S rRNA (adenine(2503)-C(2))-methyltransferase RlmN [Anaerolineaceae bacterium]|nr:23S rRNA (adenine(2503)-C(2))-methyltransferase RlmN [Anaerolineaceae bacterium]